MSKTRWRNCIRCNAGVYSRATKPLCDECSDAVGAEGHEAEQRILMEKALEIAPILQKVKDMGLWPEDK